MVQITYEECARCKEEKSCVNFEGTPTKTGDSPEWVICLKCIKELIVNEMVGS